MIGLACDFDVAFGDGLAEEIVGIDGDGRILSGQVVATVGSDIYSKRGQVVTTDADRLISRFLFFVLGTRGHFDEILAEAQVLRNVPVGTGYPEARSLGSCAESKGLIFVFDGER